MATISGNTILLRCGRGASSENSSRFISHFLRARSILCLLDVAFSTIKNAITSSIFCPRAHTQLLRHSVWQLLSGCNSTHRSFTKPNFIDSDLNVNRLASKKFLPRWLAVDFMRSSYPGSDLSLIRYGTTDFISRNR